MTYVLQSTFAKALETHFSIKRCNQDDLGNRNRVEKLVIRSLSNGGSVCVDRTNINAGSATSYLALELLLKLDIVKDAYGWILPELSVA